MLCAQAGQTAIIVPMHEGSRMTDHRALRRRRRIIALLRTRPMAVSQLVEALKVPGSEAEAARADALAEHHPQVMPVGGWPYELQFVTAGLEAVQWWLQAFGVHAIVRQPTRVAAWLAAQAAADAALRSGGAGNASGSAAGGGQADGRSARRVSEPATVTYRLPPPRAPGQPTRVAQEGVGTTRARRRRWHGPRALPL